MKIICVGRNYVEHAKELNNEVPLEPVLFLKPDTALIQKDRNFYIPDFSTQIHHEVELVVRIEKVGKNIAPKFAHKYYSQIGLGVDFTARDLQQELKEKGLPWEKSKAFDDSAVLGSLIDKQHFKDVQNINFSLKKNNILVQEGNTSQMLFSIDQLISNISKYFTLKVGDLIYTGTPKGVNTVKAGDVLEGFIEGDKFFKIAIG